MCIRFVEVTGERAILVYWDNGRMLRWTRSGPAREQRLWVDFPKGFPLEELPGTVASDPRIRQCPEGALVPASLWFKNAPDDEILREMKHTSDTFERVLSLLIVPKFYPHWAIDGDEGEDDTYDRFIGGGRYPER
ncbi:MAG: hypothetical protein NFW04_01370 [Candidatus Accumulibacter sp.]|uniref:hypothetical protein n=1 Tax=Accumulibacter sp. TaxID=2053492 RepID=UPI0025F68067|nr:hypothetical protein [Accumulibacter sp.]MCM8597299.1 hypothetical protein [Accumulibacter sp.]MCM8661596.1 hypothetical protein [Accumulibacter sp.]